MTELPGIRVSVLAALVVACGAALAACGDARLDSEARLEAMSHRTLGLAYLEENRLGEAETEFRALAQLVPGEPLGHANLGLVQLRRRQFAEAEANVRRALRLSPGNPDIRLLLAHLLLQSNRHAEALTELETAASSDPEHVRARYFLARSYSSPPSNDLAKAERALVEAVRLSPGNLALRLRLIETLVRNERTDDAAANVEEVRRQVSGPTEELILAWDEALDHLRAGRSSEALSPALSLHNQLRATPLYQAGIFQLQGAGAAVGWPLTALGQQFSVEAAAAAEIPVRYVDAGGALLIGGDGAAEPIAADVDGDGDQDLLVLSGPGSTGRGHVYLFRNDEGQFTEARAESGLADEASVTAAVFADYDNDGRLDLYLTGEAGGSLWRAGPEGRFDNVSLSAGVALAGEPGSSLAAAFADLDHDGDLDLFEAVSGPNRILRSDGAGTFSSWPEEALIGGGGERSAGIALGDFDDDAALDIVVANATGPVRLLRNQRQGRFRDVAQASGLDLSAPFVQAADYDNDGDLDLLLADTIGERSHLLRNQGGGTFEADPLQAEVRQLLEGLKVAVSTFLDFDNDGWLDLLVAGSVAGQDADQDAGIGRTVRLLRNESGKGFGDASESLPEDMGAATGAATLDYDRDGDIDLAIGGPGTVRLLRNDGGNLNHHLSVQLVGLSTGNGKANHFGLGSKIEVWADGLRQTRVATEAVTRFGLGSKTEADVLRVQWTNGVPQNFFDLGADQLVVETQVLKGSCAFLYGWDGDSYEFVTDMMWKSALGMPLGIMTEAGALYGPPDASREYLRIPGSALQPKDGVYSVQITEELWEVAYLDDLKLIAFDHPDTVSIWVDERFVPPFVTDFEIYTVGTPLPVRSAHDGQGNDVLAQLRLKDDVYVANLIPAKYQGLTRTHDLILDLGQEAAADSVLLFLNGWLFPTDASINVALGQNSELRVSSPVLQVPDGNGGWLTVMDDLSFPQGKNKTIVADVSGLFVGGDYRVRIRTNMEIYWDHAFWTKGQTSAATQRTDLLPTKADLHHRGFSRVFRKGGRYGPHWFDYSEVSAEAPWRPMPGTYTRYGDVLPLLTAADDMYVVFGAGDEMTVEFEAGSVPELKPGWSRTFLVYSDGFLKDADLNTLSGDRIEPLPFHAMSQYPYTEVEWYPADEAHRAFRAEYLTREVPGR